MKSLIIGIIIIYQKIISPILPKSCRFMPTCSQYAIESVKKFGVLRGGLKAIKRISKCHPFNTGGYDPVD